MRVAVVVSTYPPYRGGMGNVARDHAEALARAGHAVTVFAPGREVRRQASGVRCRALRPLLRVGNAAVVPQLLWRLRGFDAVELHYPFFGGAEWVWLWKRLFGRRTRFVIYYHMDTVGRGLLGAIFALYRKLFLKSILVSADVVMASSRDYFSSSQAAAYVPSDKLREVPIGVDAGRFAPRTEVVRERAALFTAALDPAHYFKGLHVLLPAFASLAKDLPDARLWIVGDGPSRPAAERLAREKGLADRVEFLGRLDDDALADRCRRALFHVLPSVDRSEAFGLVTLEAAASGTPSIVSALPGVRSVVEDGATGLHVPPGDVAALAEAMRRLFLDPEAAARLGRAARERVLARYARPAVDRLLLAAFSR